MYIKVELLVMRALSQGLVKGKIDQVSRIFMCILKRLFLHCQMVSTKDIVDFY